MKEQTIATFILGMISLSWFVEVLLQADVYTLVDWQILLPAIVYYLCVKEAVGSHESRDDLAHSLFSKLAWVSCVVLFVSTNLSLLFNVVTHVGLCNVKCIDCDQEPIDVDRCPINRLGEKATPFFYMIVCVCRYIPGGLLPMLLHAKGRDTNRFRADTRHAVSKFHQGPTAAATIPVKNYIPALVILMACMFVELLPSESTYVLMSWWPVVIFITSALMSHHCGSGGSGVDQALSKSLGVVTNTVAVVAICYAIVDTVKNGLFLVTGPCAFDGQYIYPSCIASSNASECLRVIMETNPNRSAVRLCPVNRVGKKWATILYACWSIRAIILIFYHSLMYCLYTKDRPLFETGERYFQKSELPRNVFHDLPSDKEEPRKRTTVTQ